MPQKFDARKKAHLLSEERYQRLQPEVLLRDLGLRRGQTFADIGCGPGFFTIPGAQIVGPTGHVLAADIQGEMLTAVRARAAEHGLTNVHVLKTSDKDAPLPRLSCHLILLAFVLHEMPHHATFLHRLGRALLPEGHIAVLEWEKAAQPEGPPVEDRLDPQDLIADAQAAGLALVYRRSLSEQHYLCVFERTKQTPTE